MIRGSAHVVVTCEHASHRIPASLGNLGLGTRVLASHVAWDRGARLAATALAGRLGAPVFHGRYSRLVADLNRSRHNPRVIPSVAFGMPVPGNRDLTGEERERRLARYYDPWRRTVEDAIAKLISRRDQCLHISVHSFTPRLRGRERRADVGLLYDPARTAERGVARAIREDCAARDMSVRMNYPYRGTADGFTTHCRKRFPARRYLGLEIELNQRIVRSRRRVTAVLDAVVGVLEGMSLRARG